MITFDIELHDITSLTEPMFSACGLECPAMIGGSCRKDDGKFCTLPKFETAAAEVVHSWTLDSQQSDESGSCDHNGWHALFRNPDRGTHDTDPMRAGVILFTSTRGDVTVTRFDSEADLSRSWEAIEAEEADECEGHYDTDETLASGVGIGEPTYCDGTCNT